MATIAKTKLKPKTKPMLKGKSGLKARPELKTKPKTRAGKVKSKLKNSDFKKTGDFRTLVMKTPKEKGIWQLQEAKAMFSEVVKAAQEEPQIITVHGKETAVILSYDEYRKEKTPEMSLFDFFRNSPFYGIELDISPRRCEPQRDINL